MHLREEHRVAHLRAGDDAAPRDHGGDRHAAPVALVVDELCRRHALGVGPDRPVLVPEVQVRGEIRQVDVALPEGIDMA